MNSHKAFLLCAGFGTRFRPQSLHLPKPAMPFLNLPQALFPAAALKQSGVTDFYYNSHHLPEKLDEQLSPFFKRKSVFEKEILDSAGGIANSKAHLESEENFWVANGDSLIFLNDPDVLKEAYEFHLKANATATLIGITKPNHDLSGLEYDQNKVFTKISKEPTALHFIGFYIFNKKIWSHLETGKHHIFHDVLLKEVRKRTYVFNAGGRISWYETGNEQDFINATKERLTDLENNGESSQTYKALNTWDKSIHKSLEHFKTHKVWGTNYTPSQKRNSFICVGAKSRGDFSNVKNSVIGPNLDFKSNQNFSKKVLIDSSQWT